MEIGAGALILGHDRYGKRTTNITNSQATQDPQDDILQEEGGERY